jgi:hypothetical protein
MVYSFLDTVCTITGPGGTISLGAGNANAEEGISVEFLEETDSMQIGADGSVVHNLHATQAGKFRVRLLKQSPQNNALSILYNYQRQSSLFWAQNTIVLSNQVTGDNYSGLGAAFGRFPTNDYKKESSQLEWEFNCSKIIAVLGSLLVPV